MSHLKRFISILVTLVMVLGTFGAPAQASVRLPAALTEVQQEAFAGSALSGLVEVPDGAASIGADAFSGSDVYALKIPNSVQTLGNQTAPEMAYVHFAGNTTPSSLPSEMDVRYVFGSSGNALMWAPYIGATYVDTMQLQEHEGFYYHLYYGHDDKGVYGPYGTLLCAVDNTAVPEHVTIPDAIGVHPITALSPNAFFGCDHVTSITIMGQISGADVSYPEEQEGCFDGAPNAVVSYYAQPEVRIQLPSEVPVFNWFCDLPVQLANVNYEAGSAFISCNAEFVNYSGQVTLTQENVASLPIPPAFSTADYTITLNKQLWVRAYETGARNVRISLAPEPGVPVTADGGSTDLIGLPSPSAQPMVLLEYSETVQPGSEYVVKATCLNPEAMKEYRPVELCDVAGNQLSVCYIGTYHPTGEMKTTIGQQAPSFIVRYPGANGETYSHVINTAISALTGVEGVVTAGGSASTVTVNKGESITLQCTYAGTMPQITCSSANTYIAQAALNGTALTITGVDGGETTVTVSDGTNTFTIPVKVQAPMITDILYNGVSVQAGAEMGMNQTITLQCAYSGAQPVVNCVSQNESIVTVQVDGVNILLTSTNVTGLAYINMTSGTQSFLIPVRVLGGLTALNNGADAQVNVGQSIDLPCSYTGSPTITCTSSDESIATVQMNGMNVRVTGVSTGVATITAADEYNSCSISVTVKDGRLTGITGADNLIVQLVVDESCTLECTYEGEEPAINCFSDNTGVAAVQADGSTITITGVGAGSTVVTVTDGLQRYWISVFVSNGRITDYPLNREASVAIGETARFMFSCTGSPALTCQSYNESIATAEIVDNYVVVTGVSEGSVLVVLSDGMGTDIGFSIQVLTNMSVLPELIGLNNGNPVTVTAGMTGINVPATFTYSQSGLPVDIAFSIADESIAKVAFVQDHSAHVLGLRVGTTQLTVSDGENSFTIDVNVTDTCDSTLPVLWIDLANDGALLDYESADAAVRTKATVKLCTSTPAAEFMMPFEIGLNWEFLDENGAVVKTEYRGYYNNELLSDQTILLETDFSSRDLYMELEIRWVRATLAPMPYYYLVQDPERSITFQTDSFDGIDHPIFLPDSIVYVAEDSYGVVKYQCLNPQMLDRDLPFRLVREDGTSIDMGVMTANEPVVTAKVEYQGKETESFTLWSIVWSMENMRFEEGKFGSFGVHYIVKEPTDNDDLRSENIAVGAGNIARINMAGSSGAVCSVEDESIAVVRGNYVMGVSPGVTKITVRREYVAGAGYVTVGTVNVRVYDPSVLEPATLSLALDQPVWPWVVSDPFTTNNGWTVKVVADKPVEKLASEAEVRISVTFKDAQDNVIETANNLLLVSFAQSNEYVGAAFRDQTMLNRMGILGAVKAVVRIESVSGNFTYGQQGCSVEIPMDDLANYPDHPMLFAVNNNPSDLRAGDPVSFLIKAGNTTVDKDYSLRLTCNKYTFDFQQVEFYETFNPARDKEKNFTVNLPSNAVGTCYFNIYVGDGFDSVGQFTLNIAAN